ncbi:hypothetical protein IQ254_21620 [Nodosilinea sp. LEGE 07088]|uniref:hypothetical protein n=1 Tax=Nodosilinea sp. LEGE 07088 TaxID=2777968 RepID=UPI001880F025|nr:hypothetical protein [Nodosilinea sp. LEGE 07088]MBE9139763.1 hypothetical protein [Nodosilinea sp. LEGE 07088]
MVRTLSHLQNSKMIATRMVFHYAKNHHWAFDHGWFGIDSDYRILIKQGWLDEDAPSDLRFIQEYHNQEILLPHDEEFFPDLNALAWHRTEWEIAS